MKQLEMLKMKLIQNGLEEKLIEEILEPIKKEFDKRICGLVWEMQPEDKLEWMMDKFPTLESCKGIHNDEDSINHILIEGDNLYALTGMQYTHVDENREGMIDAIYIDPPYNTGNRKFKYNDVYVNEDDEWKHSKWLSFMHKRLQLAKKLLKENGIIFISIDDREMAHLKLLCDEVFNEDNFVGNIAWEKRTKCQNTKTSKYMLQSKIEYILIYKKGIQKIKFNLVDEGKREYPEIDEKGNSYRLEQIGEMSASGMRGRDTMVFDINGINPKEGNQWKVGIDTVNEYKKRKDLIIKNQKAYFRIRPEDEDNKKQPFWSLLTKEIGTAETGKSELSYILNTKEHGFETVKPVALIKKLLFHVCANNKNAIILDFFAGSGTTAQAVMELNKDGGRRQCILCTDNDINWDTELNFYIQNGYVREEPRKNTKDHNKWDEELSAFMQSDIFREVQKSSEFKNLGICQSVTLKRLQNIMDKNSTVLDLKSKYINNNLLHYKVNLDCEESSIKKITIRNTITKFVHYVSLKEQCYYVYSDTDNYTIFTSDNKYVIVYKNQFMSDSEIKEDSKNVLSNFKDKELKVYSMVEKQFMQNGIKYISYPQEIIDKIKNVRMGD